MVRPIPLIELIEAAEGLPPAPVILTQLLTLCHDTDQHTEGICQLIERDAVLTANILRASNAATEGVDHPVATVAEAVFRLGFNAVYRKALAICAQGILQTPNLPQHQSDRLWSHSLATAVGARAIALRAGLDGEHAFMAGLLHDIGKLVICQHVSPRDWRELLTLAQHRRRPLVELERESLGLDHGAVAHLLLEFWKLPPSICAGIPDHHQPASDFGAAILCADILSYEIDLGFWGYNQPAALEEGWERLRLPLHGLDEARAAIRQEIADELQRLR